MKELVSKLNWCISCMGQPKIEIETKIEIRDTINKAINFLEQRDGWIPVSERLPELYEGKTSDCFLVTDGLFIYMAYLNSNKSWVTNSEGVIDWTNILAWQPLPKPYKEEII